MANENATVQTNVQQVDLDIDSWLSAPGAESIVTPSAETAKEAKTNIFSKAGPDLKFLDEEPADKKEEVAEEAKKDTNTVEVPRETSTENIEEVINNLDDEEPKNKAGRPRTEKSGLVEFLKKRIESKEMFAFDDYDENKQSLDDYLSGLGEKDVEDLWQANIDNLKQEVASKTPQEFFESLPDELKYAAKYVADGGRDLKGLFRALAQVEEVRSLNPADETDQEGIVRSYLQATNFGDDGEIQEEINTWKDLGVLEKKAKQFKPKLDQMQEQIVQQELQEQEERKQQQERAAQAYVQNVFEALRAGEVNGFKLDKKTQAFLYSGLVQPQYPSISGKATNLLGHLLEKYQFVEPNYPLIAETLWLLSNPEEYRQQLIKQGRNEAVQQTVRQLKTEQSNKKTSTYTEEEEPRSKKLVRPQNIFKR